MNFILFFSIVVYELQVHASEQIGFRGFPEVVGVANCTDDKCVRHHFANVTNRFEMDHSHSSRLQNQFRGLPGGFASIAQPTLHDGHPKNVDVWWQKYNFVRRMRKDVLERAKEGGSSTFGVEPAQAGNNFPSRLEPANGGGSPTSGVESANGTDHSAFKLQPANTGGSSVFGLKQSQGSSNSGLEPAVGGGSSPVEQPGQTRLHPLNDQNPTAERRLQSNGAISAEKEATAGAQVSGKLELTSTHLDSAAAVIKVPKEIPQLADELRQFKAPEESTTNDTKVKAQEESTTNNTIVKSISRERSFYTTDIINPDLPTDVSKEHDLPSKISSNAKSDPFNLAPIAFAAVPKGSGQNELTNFQKNDSETTVEPTQEEHPFGGLVPPQPWPAAEYVNVPPNQPSFVIWNPFGASNNSKLNQNLDANSTDLSDRLPSTINSSSNESASSSESNDSSDQETNSNSEGASESPAIPEVKKLNNVNISLVEIPELKNISEAGKHPSKDGPDGLPATSESTSSTTTSSVKTHIGDVIEATYESDTKTFNTVHLDHVAGYKKNLTAIPSNLLHIPPPTNRDHLKPAFVNLSCSVPSFFLSSPMQGVNMTHLETPGKASAEISHTLPNLEQPSSQPKSFPDGKTAATGQNKALFTGVISYYPMIMVPWVLVPRSSMQAAKEDIFKFTPTLRSEDDKLSSNTKTTEKGILKKDTVSSTSASWYTYPPFTDYDDVKYGSKHQSAKAHRSHFVQVMAPPLFYVGESLAFLSSNKNAKEDSVIKNEQNI